MRFLRAPSALIPRGFSLIFSYSKRLASAYVPRVQLTRRIARESQHV